VINLRLVTSNRFEVYGEISSFKFIIVIHNTQIYFFSIFHHLFIYAKFVYEKKRSIYLSVKSITVAQRDYYRLQL